MIKINYNVYNKCLLSLKIRSIRAIKDKKHTKCWFSVPHLIFCNEIRCSVELKEFNTLWKNSMYWVFFSGGISDLVFSGWTFLANSWVWIYIQYTFPWNQEKIVTSTAAVSQVSERRHKNARHSSSGEESDDLDKFLANIKNSRKPPKKVRICLYSATKINCKIQCILQIERQT